MMRYATSLSLLIGGLAACVPAAWSQGTEVLSGNCPATMLALADTTPAVAYAQKAAAYAPERDAQACLVSAEEYLGTGASAITIDTRQRGERLRVRIPGAIELGIPDIKGKPFLKNAQVVLIGSGLDTSELSAQCAALRTDNALQVRVLDGGVRALYRAGKPLAATGKALAALDWISPVELHALVLHSPNKVVLAGVDAALTIPSTLEGARRLNGNDWTKLALALRKLGEQETLVAVVTQNVESARALHDALASAHASRVFVLRDGIAGYASYRDEQARVAANADIKLIRPCGRVE